MKTLEQKCRGDMKEINRGNAKISRKNFCRNLIKQSYLNAINYRIEFWTERFDDEILEDLQEQRKLIEKL